MHASPHAAYRFYLFSAVAGTPVECLRHSSPVSFPDRFSFRFDTICFMRTCAGVVAEIKGRAGVGIDVPVLPFESHTHAQKRHRVCTCVWAPSSLSIPSQRFNGRARQSYPASISSSTPPPRLSLEPRRDGVPARLLLSLWQACRNKAEETTRKRAVPSYSVAHGGCQRHNDRDAGRGPRCCPYSLVLFIAKSPLWCSRPSGSSPPPPQTQ